MPSLACASRLVLEKGGLMNQQVSPRRGLDHRWAWSGVTRDHHPPAPAGRAEHLGGGHLGPVGRDNRLATLELSEGGAVGNAQATRPLQVEPARSFVFDQCVSETGNVVGGRKRLDPKPLVPDPVRRVQLHEVEVVWHSPDHRVQRVHERFEAVRPVQSQRCFAAAQCERLEHPWQPEVVVCVPVGDQDLVDVYEPGARTKQLALCPLAAVDEQRQSATTDEHRRQAALGGGRGTRRPEKKHAEIHPATLDEARTADGRDRSPERSVTRVCGSGRRRRCVQRDQRRCRSGRILRRCCHHEHCPVKEHLEVERCGILGARDEPELRSHRWLVFGRVVHVVEAVTTAISQHYDVVRKSVHGSRITWPGTMLVSLS